MSNSESIKWQQNVFMECSKQYVPKKVEVLFIKLRIWKNLRSWVKSKINCLEISNNKNIGHTWGTVQTNTLKSDYVSK
jgi:hypothetical protein